MNITEIEEVIKRGQELNRNYFGYEVNNKVTFFGARDVEEILKELIALMEDEEKPLVVEKFFYFDYVEFTGQGGVF